MRLKRNDKGEFEEVRYSNPTPEMLILSKLDELKEELDIVSSKLLITEAIPKEQYENRLKADMVAMLEDLDLQIDESAAYNLEVAKVQRLIRDRIDKLKENTNGDK